jgi:protein tyrosine phosphatase (PTP) superfamily phosphohydrolase (DUF442 family)
MKTALQWLMVASLLTIGAGSRAEDGAYSEHVARVADNTVIAGTLDLDALKAQHPDDVLIVDLRTPAEGTAEEAKAAEALGFSYENIPVSSPKVDPAQVDALRALLDGADADTLVVVHCASGNRAGMLWGAMRVEDGVPVGSVEETLSGVLTKPPTIAGLKGYAQALNAEP